MAQFGVASLGRLAFRYQLAIALSIYVGLFFLEYPPIFLLGYWSWGALVHKTLTGVLLAANLVLAEYAVKRLHLFEKPKS
jgi:hypothetical protein